MLLKIVGQDVNRSYHEWVAVETRFEQNEISVSFVHDDEEETYDVKAGAFFIQTPQGWEKVG